VSPILSVTLLPSSSRWLKADCGLMKGSTSNSNSWKENYELLLHCSAAA